MQHLKQIQLCKQTVSSPRFWRCHGKIGLDKLGINGPETIYHNLSYDDLFEHEVENNEGETKVNMVILSLLILVILLDVLQIMDCFK